MHREVRVRSGSTSWADAEVEIVDARDKKPWAARQQTPFCTGSSKLFSRRTPTRMTRSMISLALETWRRNPFLSRPPCQMSQASTRQGDAFHAAISEVVEKHGRMRSRPPTGRYGLFMRRFGRSNQRIFRLCVKICIVFREYCNRRAYHEVISVEVKKALCRTLARKCKVSEIQEGVPIHK